MPIGNPHQRREVVDPARIIAPVPLGVRRSLSVLCTKEVSATLMNDQGRDKTRDCKLTAIRNSFGLQSK